MKCFLQGKLCRAAYGQAHMKTDRSRRHATALTGHIQGATAHRKDLGRSIIRTAASTLAILGFAIMPPVAGAGDAPKGATDEKTFESARSDLLGKWKKVRSLTATIRSKTYIEFEDGYTDITGVGSYQFLKHDGKDLVHTHVKLEVVYRKEQQVHTDRKEVTTYDDGSIMYTVRDEGEEQFASKDVVTERSAMDAIWVFETMSNYYHLTRLPDVQMEGEVVYVIQGTPKDDDSPSGQVAMYLSKASAALVKYEMYDQNGRVITTMSYSNITLNPKLKLDRFLFKPSDDLVVEDHTLAPPKLEDAKTPPDHK